MTWSIVIDFKKESFSILDSNFTSGVIKSLHSLNI